MNYPPAASRSLHALPTSPVPGLAVYERRVPSPRATVVAIHGGLDRGMSFARLARRLDDVDFITYDRRGYQGSRARGPVDFPAHVDDLLNLTRAQSADGPVIFFGHSYGGVVATGAAIAAPDLVSFVVNYESPYSWLEPRRHDVSPPSDDPALEAERFFRRVVSDDVWQRLSEREREERRLDGPALLRDLQLVHGHVDPFNLADLQTPLLYVYGDGVAHDYYDRLAQRLRQLNPLVDVATIAHASHGAHLSAPDTVAAVLRRRWESQCASV